MRHKLEPIDTTIIIDTDCTTYNPEWQGIIQTLKAFINKVLGESNERSKRESIALNQKI